MSTKLKINPIRIFQSIRQFIKKIFPIIIGSVLIAVSYNVLVVPYGLLSGGYPVLRLLGIICSIYPSPLAY